MYIKFLIIDSLTFKACISLVAAPLPLTTNSTCALSDFNKRNQPMEDNFLFLLDQREAEAVLVLLSQCQASNSRPLGAVVQQLLTRLRLAVPNPSNVDHLLPTPTQGQQIASDGYVEDGARSGGGSQNYRRSGWEEDIEEQREERQRDSSDEDSEDEEVLQFLQQAAESTDSGNRPVSIECFV